MRPLLILLILGNASASELDFTLTGTSQAGAPVFVSFLFDTQSGNVQSSFRDGGELIDANGVGVTNFFATIGGQPVMAPEPAFSGVYDLNSTAGSVIGHNTDFFWEFNPVPVMTQAEFRASADPIAKLLLNTGYAGGGPSLLGGTAVSFTSVVVRPLERIWLTGEIYSFGLPGPINNFDVFFSFDPFTNTFFDFRVNSIECNGLAQTYTLTYTNSTLGVNGTCGSLINFGGVVARQDGESLLIGSVAAILEEAPVGVPEPSVAGLMLLGFMLILFCGRSGLSARWDF